MNRKILPFALGLTLAAVAAAWIVSVRRAPDTDVVKPPLYPGLMERVNDVARMEIRSQGSAVTLVRDGEAWLVENRDRHPALFEGVKRTAVSIADLRILAPKTRREALYPRLGVEDVDAEAAASRLVRLLDAKGEPLAELIAGRERTSDPTAGDRKAMYVRKAGDAQSYLVEGEVLATARPTDWMDTGIVDIPADRIYAVEIVQPDGSTAAIARTSREVKDYALADLPPGQEARSLALLTSLGTALGALRFEDVAAAGKVAFPDAGASRASYRTFDGLVIDVSIAKVDGRDWARIAARFDPAAALAPPAADAAATPAAPADAGDKVSAEAAAINARLSPWLYALPEFKVSMMTKKKDELLKPVGSGAEGGDAPGGALVPGPAGEGFDLPQ